MLRQKEQHEQIEIMANYGPFCKGIENDKGNIFESELWKKIVNVYWCVSRVPQYMYVLFHDSKILMIYSVLQFQFLLTQQFSLLRYFTKMWNNIFD